MASLNLKTKAIEGDGTLISWTDVESEGGLPFIAFLFGILLTGIGVYSIDTNHPSAAFLGSVLAAMFLGWIPGLFFWLIFKGYTQRERPRRISVFPKSIEHNGRSYLLDKISRVEYGRKGDWDNSAPQAREHTQVRIWFEDTDFIAVSENNWTTQMNHKLHSVIQDTIVDYQRRLKDLAYDEQEADINIGEASRQDDFGIPDY